MATVARVRLSGWSRLSARTRPAQDQTGRGIKEGASVIVLSSGGQDQAADAGAPMPRPASRP